MTLRSILVVAALVLGACAAPATQQPTGPELQLPPDLPAVAAVPPPSEDAAAPRTQPVAAPAPVPWTPGEWAPPPTDAEPWGVWIPRLDVVANLTTLGLTRSGELEVPERFDVAGWYLGGPRPGETGPAVVAGHVDSHTGPAVFARLHELREGDVAHIVYTDRTVMTFRIRGGERYGKDEFPTEAVYGDTPRPALRLITCGGSFDEAEGSYRDNVVVYADILATWSY